MKTLTLLFCLALTTCQSTKNSASTIDIQSPDYKAYKTQKHRFMLNGCELTYNEQPFYIGMPLNKVITMLGKESKTYRTEFYPGDSKRYYWEPIGIEIIGSNTLVEDIYIYIKNTYDSDFTGTSILGNKSVILNNQLLTQTEKMHEYVKKAGISFEDFRLSNSGYSKEYICKNDILTYDIDSRLDRERIGSGHLYTSGDWLLENTNQINYIHIYKKEK